MWGKRLLLGMTVIVALLAGYAGLNRRDEFGDILDTIFIGRKAIALR
jgi:hypothetical protein